VDPLVSTIIKQGTAIGRGVGMLAFVIFFVVRMASLQHALTLNIMPRTLP
jgi:hypothetical protein